ncbi:sensor histidine kinase [Viridibacillus sp. NPDC096237]|uniref:sensor histidine kinase n=1 Tax=Viridibacillus sp. NPDC096237 TaxID=3390721 RepID=UPI003CFBEDCD
MKWRLTGRFLATVVLVVILVIFINIFVLIALLIAQSAFNKPIFHNTETSAEAFTRLFQDEITELNNHVTISEKGKKELDKKNAWIQILDENGKEIYNYRTPNGVKKKYTPTEIVNMYKYQEVNVIATVFISEKNLNQKRYSYFMGFNDPYINKRVLSYDSRNVVQMFKVGSIVLILLDSLIALFIGYLFSKRLTSPLNTLIDGIKRMANKDYNINYESKGIYKDVFYNLNNLSFQLKSSEMERKKLEKMKEEWIGNISHDIKTPLASIQGFAEMMKNTDYNFTLDEMREYAEIIERKSLYMTEVIKDLNLSTRLKNKKLLLNKNYINLVTLLRNILIDTLNDTKYSNRNIEFQFSEETIKLDVDEILIRRAITNLINNAIVHNDEDVKIIVSIEKKERTQIRIKDHGKGIVKDELEIIFDRYYRGTNTGESHKGSGLGMAIANDIIQAHNGEITIDSVIGRGTTIEIHL